MRILVVDDDPDVRMLVQAVLELSDSTCEVRTVDSANAAMRYADWADVAVVDLMMPQVDGVAVARHLRQLRGDTVKVVVLSAAGNVDQIMFRWPQIAGLADTVIAKSGGAVADKLRRAVLGGLVDG